MDPIVIVSAVRTPMGHFGGCFKAIPAPELGAVAIRAAVAKSRLPAEKISQVLMGCVLTAGQGQAPARQAAIGAGLPFHTPCTTINKMCGSGMAAIFLAHDALIAKSTDYIIAGGMENMSRAPYLLQKARFGYRMGHHLMYDHMLLDGLEDAYDKGKSMGYFAEQCASQYQFSRETMDEFAKQSLLRAKKANETGAFLAEIAPVQNITHDENATQANPDKIPHLKPAFLSDGKITAASSSAISDGAAALLLTRLSLAKEAGLTPLAKIIGHYTHAQEPALFTTAPVVAIQALLKHIQWDIKTVDLFEINEAFAVVTLRAIQALDLSADIVNIHGGACALGHPIGASGARIVVTLIHALKQKKLKRGVAALCIGGGEATAIALEIL